MNLNTLHKQPALIAAGAGFLGLMLRALLYRIGFDEKGILSASHPLHLACLVLTVLTVSYLALRAARTEDPGEYPRLRLLLGFLAGCFLLIQGLLLYRQATAPLTLIRCVLTVVSGLAMVLCVLPGTKASRAAACHGLICIAYGADMLGRYRVWSGNPQLPDYVFHVLAGVSLTLGAYQALALHTGLGSPKLRRFFCLCALFLCLMCLVGPEPWEFYLSGALWAVCCLLTRVPPEPEVPQEEESDVPA